MTVLVQIDFIGGMLPIHNEIAPIDELTHEADNGSQCARVATGLGIDGFPLIVPAFHERTCIVKMQLKKKLLRFPMQVPGGIDNVFPENFKYGIFAHFPTNCFAQKLR